LDKPIGVFDSGIGGLTVVKELIRHLPNEDIVYFGDTAHLPYGTKSKETIIHLSLENILFLLRQEVKLICVACNTSSSIALPFIRNYFKVPIIGVITAGVRCAIYATRNKRIGVIGTPATIKSKAYEKEIKQINPKIYITSVACPLFVPLVEEGWTEGQVALAVARRYLKPLKETKVDTVILGCTHYPLLKNIIKKVLGDNVRLIDSAQAVAEEIKKVLINENLLNKNKTASAKLDFYVSDDPEGFSIMAKRFLGKPIKGVKKINV